MPCAVLRTSCVNEPSLSFGLLPSAKMVDGLEKKHIVELGVGSARKRWHVCRLCSYEPRGGWGAMDL